MNEFCARELQNLLQAYWKVAAKRIIDNVPLTIDRTMVESASRCFWEQCVHLSDEQINQAFQEPEHIHARREELKQIQSRLSDAIRALKSMGTFWVSPRRRIHQ